MARLGENVNRRCDGSDANPAERMAPGDSRMQCHHNGFERPVFPTPDGSRRDVEPESVMRRAGRRPRSLADHRRADNRVSVQTTRSLDLSHLSVEELEVFERALQKSLAR
jgi:hypothetical protein